MTTTPALNDDLVRRLRSIGGMAGPVDEDDNQAAHDAADCIISQANEIEALRSALEPFAAEANQWDDSVPDNHRSLCTEPGSDKALFGSETVFTLGDLRRARTALKGAS